MHGCTRASPQDHGPVSCIHAAPPSWSASLAHVPAQEHLLAEIASQSALTCHKKAHSVGSLPRPLSGYLGPVSDLAHQARGGHGGVKDEPASQQPLMQVSMGTFSEHVYLCWTCSAQRIAQHGNSLVWAGCMYMIRAAGSWVLLMPSMSENRPLLVVEALVAHVLAQGAAIGDQAGDGDAHVVVDLENLVQGGAELRAGSLQRGHHHTALALHPATLPRSAHGLANKQNLSFWGQHGAGCGLHEMA